jgi:hypothetical protein
MRHVFDLMAISVTGFVIGFVLGGKLGLAVVDARCHDFCEEVVWVTPVAAILGGVATGVVFGLAFWSAARRLGSRKAAP